MEKQKSFVYTENLTVGYDGKPLIRDIRLSLEKGQILTLIGPNGAGKSTIFKKPDPAAETGGRRSLARQYLDGAHD